MLNCSVMNFRSTWFAALLLCGPALLTGCSKEVPPPAPQAGPITAITMTCIRWIDPKR